MAGTGPRGFSAETAFPVFVPATNLGTGVSVTEFSVSSGKNVVCKTIYRIGFTGDPERTVWIFTGYKPAGDPYLQSPGIFAKKWDLENLSAKTRTVFFIPDMGTSVYRLTKKNTGEITDVDWLKAAYDKFRSAIRSKKILLIGVSTGAEGAVKFASTLDDVPPVVAISGTYDLFSLPENGGEYRLHQREYGRDPAVWTNENPLFLLRKNAPGKVYLFCEEKSQYFMQAVSLSTAQIPGMTVSNFLYLGKGRRHDWDFWGDRRVVKAVAAIVGKD